MTSFAHAVVQDTSSNQSLTSNGALTNASSLNSLVDLFFLIGSSRGKDIREQFGTAFNADPHLAVKMLFWARDIRGGAGERGMFRSLIKHLESVHFGMVQKVLPLVPVYGRWDDLLVFENTEVQRDALALYAQALQEGNALAAKWAPRKGPVANALRKVLGLDPKGYRQLVVSLSKTVETQMCARQWNEINYEHVPSVAAARYQKAFNKRDTERYSAYKAAAVKGEAKINAQAVYPYDVLKSVKFGDADTALAQWNSLPNYLGDDGILPMVDVSGSMSCLVNGNGNLSCMDMSVSLGLYIADRQRGAFKDMFLTFSAQPKLNKLEGSFLVKVRQLQRADWGGNTDLEAAFREILRVAVGYEVPQSEMPKYLVVLSDMEFDAGSRINQTAWDRAKEMFARAQYQMPKVVWWNLNARPGNLPVTAHATGAALVSGFSPSVMKSILSAKDFNPHTVMLDTVNSPRYQAVEDALVSREV